MASLGRYLLLLGLGSVADDGQRADADVGAEGHRETGELADGFGDERAGDLVHLQAAVLFGDVDGHEAEVAGFAEQGAGDGEVLGFDLGGRRQHFVGSEFHRGFGDLAVFVGEVLGRENILRVAFFDEEAAAFYAFCHSGSIGCGH